MKKIFFTITILLFGTAFYAQNSFDKYDGQDDVNSIIVTKKMFELMSKVQVDASDTATQKYLNLTKKLDNLKVFSTQNDAIKKDMKATAADYVKATNLVQYKKVNDAGKTVNIYTNSGATAAQTNELFMFIENTAAAESVLMDLKGNFSLNEISLLIDKMQIPGGSYLK